MNLDPRYLDPDICCRAAKYFGFSLFLTVYLYQLSLVVIQYAATLLKRAIMGFKR